MYRMLKLGMKPGRLGEAEVGWYGVEETTQTSRGQRSTLAYTYSGLHQGKGAILLALVVYLLGSLPSSSAPSDILKHIRWSWENSACKTLSRNGQRFRVCEALATRCEFQEMSADSYTRRVDSTSESPVGGAAPSPRWDSKTTTNTSRLHSFLSPAECVQLNDKKLPSDCS